MFTLLSQRQGNLIEQMDAEDADCKHLEQTYADFYALNRLISQWNRVYAKYIRPHAKEIQRQGNIFKVCDVGCGGGDIAFLLFKWLKKDGINAHIIGIDIDNRAIAWAKANRIVSAETTQVNKKKSVGLFFECISTSELIHRNHKVDLVINNHVLHHIPFEKINPFLTECAALGTRVICNDLERSSLAYSLFSLCFPLRYRSSFIYQDGLISLKKSFRKKELEELSSIGWRVQRLFPFRLLLMYEAKS
ncbi:MAG: methyltransferase domain-containing protein [Bacteroidota bacterium]|nr:methyltransferase domain-containing protein [Bacteroidota bacterium]